MIFIVVATGEWSEHSEQAEEVTVTQALVADCTCRYSNMP